MQKRRENREVLRKKNFAPKLGISYAMRAMTRTKVETKLYYHESIWRSIVFNLSIVKLTICAQFVPLETISRRLLAFP